VAENELQRAEEGDEFCNGIPRGCYSAWTSRWMTVLVAITQQGFNLYC